MPKSFEKQFLHFARCITLEIGPSVQECWNTVILHFSPFYHFILRLVPGSLELRDMNPNSIMVDFILPIALPDSQIPAQ